MISHAIQLHQAGRFAEAEAAYRNILSQQPKNASALHLLGLIYLQQNVLEAAIELIGKAIAVDKRQALFHANLGVALKQQGEHYFDLAGREASGREQHLSSGELCFAKALKCLNTAVRLSPGFTDAHHNRARLLKAQGKYRESLLAYKKVITLSPDRFEAWNDMGSIYLKRGEVAAARDAFLKGSKCPHHGHKAYSNYLLSLNYDLTDGDYIADQHRQWQTRFADQIPAASTHANSAEPDRVLNVGYVSADFHHHSVAYFAEPLIAGHRREACRVFCYSDSGRSDGMQQHLRQHSDGWHDIKGLSDEAVARLIAADSIDILVDLAGHTAGNRLPLFALKPAPVQVSYIGYPNTTGLDAMDYRITDAMADPAGDELYNEQMIRLPGGFLCYSPNIEKLPVSAELPLQQHGHVTFGCFNILAKISDATLQAWAGLLNDIPDSRMLIKNVAMGDKETRQQLLKRFARLGIHRKRLDLIGWTASREEHFSLYNRVDVALDTFPYNGTTTTCEALWMGVPVITLAGSLHAGRVGVSLLSRVGLDACIAGSEQLYIDAATKLVQHPEQLLALRDGLHQKVERNLGRREQLIEDIESAYRNIWQEWCAVKAK